jgi:hypothetical protein
MRLLTVNVVEKLIPGPKETGFTAIDKRPQPGRVHAGELGLAGVNGALLREVWRIGVDLMDELRDTAQHVVARG